MAQSDPIVVGWMTLPTRHSPIRAMVLYRAGRDRVWKSIGALRWQPLPRGAVFTPDPAVKPQEA